MDQRYNNPNQNPNYQQYNQYYQNVQGNNGMNRIPINNYPNNYGHQGINRPPPQQNVVYVNQQPSFLISNPQQNQQYRPYQQPPSQIQQQQQYQQQYQPKMQSFVYQNRSSEGFKRLLQTKYIIANEIGKGSFAKVFKGVNSETGERIAIKKIDKNKFDASYLELIDSEISVLAQLNNEHIIKFLDLYNEGDYIYIVTELCELGDLEVFIKKNFTETKMRLPEELVKVFAYQILLAFLGIADMNIIHRDMKLSNVLISKNLRLKVADFGLAKSSHEKDKDQVGTPMTMAPEVLNNLGYDCKCDVWSVGCMIFEMLEGRPPFLPMNNGGIEELKRLINQRQLIYRNQNISNNAKNLIDQMLTLNPKNRISWHEMFAHEWFGDCVSQGEPFIKKISQDYSNFVDLEEKHLDPEFARDFGFLLRDFITYHVDTFYREIKKAQDSLVQFNQNMKNFPPGEKQANLFLLQQVTTNMNILVALLFNHVFAFRHKKQCYQLPIPKYCKEQIQQRYKQQFYEDAIKQDLTPAKLQEKIYQDLFKLSNDVMCQEFEFFKCNFTNIVNFINILTHPEKGFLQEVVIDETNLSADNKDRICLINIDKAYFEEFSNQDTQIKKDIIFNRSFIRTNNHEKNTEKHEQVLLFSEIVFGYQQEVIQKNQMPQQNQGQQGQRARDYQQNY